MDISIVCWTARKVKEVLLLSQFLSMKRRGEIDNPSWNKLTSSPRVDITYRPFDDWQICLESHPIIVHTKSWTGCRTCKTYGSWMQRCIAVRPYRLVRLAVKACIGSQTSRHLNQRRGR